MAESIFTWTKRGTIVVRHRGDQVEVNVPEWMQGDLVNNPTGMLDQIRQVMDDRTIVASILSDKVIDLRAAIRPNDTDDEPKELDKDAAKKLAPTWTPPAVKPPQSKKAEDPMSAIEALKKAGWTLEDIEKHFSS